MLIRADAVPEPTFLWWDVRPQPRFGTVEVRIMDAQTTLADTAALAALVQSIVPARGRGGRRHLDCGIPPEVLAENRFLAARDGMDAQLIDPTLRRLVPLRTTVERLVDDCYPHAMQLGCAAALEDLPRLLRANAQTRAAAARHGLGSVAPALADHFRSREFPPALTRDADRKERPCAAGSHTPDLRS